MLPRLTVALVLAGLGLLWAGAVRDSLVLVYLSILCTAIAGVALIVYIRVSRRRAVNLATNSDLQAMRAQESRHEHADPATADARGEGASDRPTKSPPGGGGSGDPSPGETATALRPAGPAEPELPSGPGSEPGSQPTGDSAAGSSAESAAAGSPAGSAAGSSADSAAGSRRDSAAGSPAESAAGSGSGLAGPCGGPPGCACGGAAGGLFGSAAGDSLGSRPGTGPERPPGPGPTSPGETAGADEPPCRP